MSSQDRMLCELRDVHALLGQKDIVNNVTTFNGKDWNAFGAVSVRPALLLPVTRHRPTSGHSPAISGDMLTNGLAELVETQAVVILSPEFIGH
jgi:hypothetical protein